MLTHEEEKRMLKKIKKEFWDEDRRARIKKKKKLINRDKKRHTPEYIIDCRLNKQATKHGGFLYLSYILNTFKKNMNEHLDSVFGYPSKLFKSWAIKETNKNGATFIQGFDKNHPNVRAIWSAITSGFLDDKDIQNDLGLKSKRQADRILTPSLHDDVRHMNQVFKHIPAKYIVRVWHIKQDSKVSNRIYGAGRRPQKVVSVENYLQFLLNSYKDIVPKKININKYYTKFGKQLVHDWEFSSNQNRELTFIIQSSYIKYIRQQDAMRKDEFSLLNNRRYLDFLQCSYLKYMSRFTRNVLRYCKVAKSLKKVGKYFDIYKYICQLHNYHDVSRCNNVLFPEIFKQVKIVYSKQKRFDKDLKKYLRDKSFMDNFRKKYPINTRSKLFTKYNKTINLKRKKY